MSMVTAALKKKKVFQHSHLIVIVGHSRRNNVRHGRVVPEGRRRDKGGRVAPTVVEVVAPVDSHRRGGRQAKDNLEDRNNWNENHATSHERKNGIK